MGRGLRLSKSCLSKLLSGANKKGVNWFSGYAGKLAPFFLKGRTPERIQSLGVAQILLQLKGIGEDSPFRSAVVFPVRWIKNRNGAEKEKSMLPRDLLDLAERVKRDSELLNIGGDIDFCDWMAQPYFGYDISDWDDTLVQTWDSAWGALASGLVLARMDLNSRPDIMISAAWGDVGLRGVDGLEEKAQAAKELGVKRLFVSGFPSRELSELVKDNEFAIEYLPPNKDLKTTLNPILYSLGVEPVFSDWEDRKQWDRCREYAKNLNGIDRKRGETYIGKNITPAKAAELRGKGASPHIDSMAILVSRPSAALLSILTFQPEHVLLLFSERDAKDNILDEVRNLCAANRDGFIIPRKIDHRQVRVDTGDEIRQALTDWMDGPYAARVLDVTGTTVIASVEAVLCCAGKSNLEIMAVQTINPEKGGAYLPGYEKIIWVQRKPEVGEERNAISCL